MKTNTQMKPITHLEHPEDLVLSGDFWVFDALLGNEGFISQKIDGCPAIVWGTHPVNGEFFVGTKSVFNKKKIKICYSSKDVDSLYSGDNYDDLRRVLKACLKHLPRTEDVYQGDFIGFGGDNTYKPNTLTYVFPEVVEENIIVAPHTFYIDVDNSLSSMQPFPLEGELISTSKCKFIQPIVDRVALNNEIVLDKDNYSFLSKKQLAQAKKEINALIREGIELTDLELYRIIGDEHLVNLYQLVIAYKEEFMENCITYSEFQTYLGDEKVQGEGFVLHTEDGAIKLVNREEFAIANFTQGKFS